MTNGTLVPFTTYDIATGELLQPMFGSEIAVMEAQSSPATDYVFGHHDSDKYRVERGEVVLKPSTDQA